LNIIRKKTLLNQLIFLSLWQTINSKQSNMVAKKLFFLFSILLSMVGNKALAFDIAVKNADGITIYYNYINDGKELSVTSGTFRYSGSVVIPEEVTYMNRTRKVTSIWVSAFYYCSNLNSVSIPNSVTKIGEYNQEIEGVTNVEIIPVSA